VKTHETSLRKFDCAQKLGTAGVNNFTAEPVKKAFIGETLLGAFPIRDLDEYAPGERLAVWWNRTRKSRALPRWSPRRCRAVEVRAGLKIREADFAAWFCKNGGEARS
jgi:hypothetical protein